MTPGLTYSMVLLHHWLLPICCPPLPSSSDISFLSSNVSSAIVSPFACPFLGLRDSSLGPLLPSLCHKTMLCIVQYTTVADCHWLFLVSQSPFPLGPFDASFLGFKVSHTLPPLWPAPPLFLLDSFLGPQAIATFLSPPLPFFFFWH